MLKRSFFAVLFILTGLFTIGISTTAAQTTPTAVVTAYHLNVRDYPSPYTGNILTRISRNEVYTVTARSSLNNWWQLRLSDGRLGWVNGVYVTVYNGNLVPVINPNQPTPTQSFGTVTAFHLNVRHMPNPYTGSIIARISRNEVYAVVGRNADTSWWQLRLNDGRLGWVNGRYLSVSNPHLVPQTDNTTPQPPVVNATGVVTSYFLNVRTAPNAITGARITVIARNQIFPVVGRNASSSWWQIRLGDGRLGWVSGRYFSVTNGHSLPITG